VNPNTSSSFSPRFTVERQPFRPILLAIELLDRRATLDQAIAERRILAARLGQRLGQNQETDRTITALIFILALEVVQLIDEYDNFVESLRIEFQD
jgi:hypothetical protein